MDSPEMADDGVLAYAFDADHPVAAEVDRDRTDLGAGGSDPLASLLGGKGAGLVRMTSAGLPVPPGFTLTTDACRRFRAHGWSSDFDDAIESGLFGLEHSTGRSLARSGGSEDAPPLLVSVRSGARISMPGMMDTVLDVGMNDEAQRCLGAATGDPDFAADTHRRALRSYAEMVLRVPPDLLEIAEEVASPAERRALLARHGFVVPTDPVEQIRRAAAAVFESWDLPRSVRYREVEGIADDEGTAATVQAMVFGNLGERSGTGVAFTRDPATGARGLMGDFLAGAQGEDVVSGGRRTAPLQDVAAGWPDAWDALARLAVDLEIRHGDMVDIEFTIEDGHLWILQARRGKRSPIAAFRMAIDMAEDPGFPVDRAEAVRRCAAYLDDPPRLPAGVAEGLVTIATGLPASPGRASGVLCLDPDAAVDLDAAGVAVVLARRETSPADVHGMAAARGLFTTRGGMVSHAAVVARSWGLPAVVGALGVEIDDLGVRGPGGAAPVGALVTVDGDTGEFSLGGTTDRGPVAPEVAQIRSWQDMAITSGGGAPPVTTTGGPDHFALLHALRIKGMATVDAVAATVGLDPPMVDASLRALAEQGLVVLGQARGLWRLTETGQAHHGEELALRSAGIDAQLVGYPRFLELNTAFKQLCTDWQIREGMPNDHADPGYDTSVLARLDRLHEEASTVVTAMAQHVGVFSRYRGRLDAAVAAVSAGEHRRFTGVLCDSYHDIWMELHEDLIVRLGIDRAAEGST